jgi:uncharacterized protein YbjT (DUF2867 family)
VRHGDSIDIPAGKMPRLIAVTGATGNQGGSVAKLLLRYPEEYIVRAITRDGNSGASKALADLGAEIIQADLTRPETLSVAVEGCWGVFGVTNFYDSVSPFLGCRMNAH